MANISGINAYLNQMKMMQGADSTASTNTAISSPSFADLVGDALSSSANTLQKSEALQTESLTGARVDLADLVTAVADAELTLNTVVAIRDRVINAYQDIIKMPI